MTAPGGSAGFAPLVPFGSEHAGTGWWKFTLATATHAMFLGGTSVQLRDEDLNVLGNGTEWSGQGAIDLFVGNSYTPEYTGNYTSALWATLPFSDASILLPGTYYVHAEGGVAFGYHQSLAFGHWVDPDEAEWNGGDFTAAYQWVDDQPFDATYFPYSTATWLARLADAVNVVGVVADPVESVGSEGEFLFAGISFAASPSTDIGFYANTVQTAWGFKPVYALISYTWPDLPPGAAGQLPEGPGTPIDARVNVIYTVRFQSSDTATYPSVESLGPSTHLDATHEIRAAGFSYSDMDVSRAYSPTGTTVWTPADPGPSSVDTFNASSIMAEDGSFAIKTAMVINRADVPPAGGATAWNHTTRMLAHPSAEWLVQLPRFHHQYWLPMVTGTLPDPGITAEDGLHRARFSA